MIAHPKPASDGVYFFTRRLVSGLARILIRQEVAGVENIPAEGPFLITANHLSAFDPPIGLINIPRRAVAFAADKWRRVPFICHLLETMGVIWVARGEADTDAIKAALHVLKAGGALGIAPEGRRSPTHQLQRGKTGAAYLAARAQVPIVPVAIAGTEKVKYSLIRLRRATVRCVIGKPYCLPPDSRPEPGRKSAAKSARLEEDTDLIMCHLAALLPPEYRGVYADHPLLIRLLNRPS